MYKTHDGCYRHRQFDIERDTSGHFANNGWYVLPTDDYEGVIIPDWSTPFRTLRDAIEDINRAIAADLRCPHCDLWIGDPEWPGLAFVDHDIDKCGDL